MLDVHDLRRPFNYFNCLRHCKSFSKCIAWGYNSTA